jgi:hypothetical protein
MTDEIALSDDDLDKIEAESRENIQTTEEIRQNAIDNDREIVNDTSADDEVNLGDLGTFKKADPKDLEDVFDKLSGTIFQLKTCLFRVSFINRGQNRFTAELINQ